MITSHKITTVLPLEDLSISDKDISMCVNESGEVLGSVIGAAISSTPPITSDCFE